MKLTLNHNAIFAILLFLGGCYILWESVALGLVEQNAPGAGLFPAISGAGISVLSLIQIVKYLIKSEEVVEFPTVELFRSAICTAAIVLFVLLSHVIGMYPSAFIMAFLVSVAFSTITGRNLLVSAIIAGAVTLMTYVIFSLFLSVPLV